MTTGINTFPLLWHHETTQELSWISCLGCCIFFSQQEKGHWGPSFWATSPAFWLPRLYSACWKSCPRSGLSANCWVRTKTSTASSSCVSNPRLGFRSAELETSVPEYASPRWDHGDSDTSCSASRVWLLPSANSPQFWASSASSPPHFPQEQSISLGLFNLISLLLWKRFLNVEKT